MTIVGHRPILITNDPPSFDELFVEHYDRVYGILYRLVGTRAEAEDLAQEVFLKLYQDPPRRLSSNVGAWLYRVATNKAYNAVRNRKRRWQHDTGLIMQETDSNDPAQQVERDAEAALVRQALAQLPTEQSQLLILRHMGLSYAELARACELTPSSVGKLLSRAAQKFRTAYILMSKERHHV